MGLWRIEVFEKLQAHFPIKLKEVVYDFPGRWQVDGYLRAKKWLGITSRIHHHTTAEKLLMLMTGLITVPMSLVKHFSTGINGGYIAVAYEKA